MKKNQLCVYHTSKNNTIKKKSIQFTSSEFFILSIGIAQTKTAYSHALDQRKTTHLCRWCPDFLMSQSHYHLKWQGLVPPTVDVLFCGVCIVRRSAKRLMLVWKATACTRGHGRWGWRALFNYPRLIFRAYPEGRLCQLADCCLAPRISASTRTNRAILCSTQTKTPCYASGQCFSTAEFLFSLLCVQFWLHAIDSGLRAYSTELKCELSVLWDFAESFPELASVGKTASILYSLFLPTLSGVAVNCISSPLSLVSFLRFSLLK